MTRRPRATMLRATSPTSPCTGTRRTCRRRRWDCVLTCARPSKGSRPRRASTSSRDISEYAYRRGAASLLDFLDAERSYRATQLAYRQSLATYMLALEQLREAVGTRALP